ncbi:serine hydrolase domain-containing protein [Aureliella helgolandensis]|uniref:Esterase EstB n=1 Tax=Aureliella helgolandensis TaxID=2527968 RepID=A0A518G6G0_9BACT|nr:serine hydrolase domain-containing protein [Aureliella helgolandensis]QDV24178.1 Esterase EstB [Aureliella helgolandensis]
MGRFLVSATLTLLSAWIVRAEDTQNARTQPVTISERALQLLSAELARYVEQDRTVGAELLVIQADKVLLHESLGYSDRESERKWQNNTVCNIRSMTKSLTSAAAQILIDRGELQVDAPVAKYLPSFRTEATRAITVQHVLTHRSGLPLTILQSPKDFSSLSEQVAASAQAELQFEPGTKFWYSDAGADVVAALVEKVSGETMDQFVQRELIKPLGMQNTFYGIDSGHPRFQDIATLYLGGPKSWSAFWKTSDDLFYPFAWGSQTLYSTATDYTKFLSMLLNRGQIGERSVLNTSAIRRMVDPTSRLTGMGTEKPMPTGFRGLQAYYGQMLVTYRVDENSPVVAFGHSGSDGTIAWAWPKHNLIIAYFTQSRGGQTPLRMEAAIDRLLFSGADDGQVAERLKPYMGQFTANFAQFQNEEFTVSAQGEKLYLDVPSQMTFELLEPEQGNLWAFAMAPDKIQVEFVRDAEDAIVALRMHQAGHTTEVPLKTTEGSKEESTETNTKSMPRKAELPTAEAIIAKFVEVTGGRFAYEASSSMSNQGSLVIPRAGIKGSFELIYANGGKWCMQSDLGATGMEKSGSDGQVAWAQAGAAPARKLQGAELLQAQQEADLQARLHPKKYYESMKTIGIEKIQDEDCYRVELKSSSGDVTIEYFSTVTGFLVRRRSKQSLPVGKIDVIEEFADYRAAGDRIAWHTSVKHLPGGIDVIIKLEKVQFNQPIDAARFKLP